MGHSDIISSNMGDLYWDHLSSLCITFTINRCLVFRQNIGHNKCNDLQKPRCLNTTFSICCLHDVDQCSQACDCFPVLTWALFFQNHCDGLRGTLNEMLHIADCMYTASFNTHIVPVQQLPLFSTFDEKIVRFFVSRNLCFLLLLCLIVFRTILGTKLVLSGYSADQYSIENFSQCILRHFSKLQKHSGYLVVKLRLKQSLVMT